MLAPAGVPDLIRAVMSDLAAARPVFHTEADFQHAFAWQLRTLRPDASIRLERRLAADTNERLDVLVALDDMTVAVELKYPVSALEAVVDDEPFLLRNHGAEDLAQFSYVWDIVRVERLVAAGAADAGAAVLLSNTPKLWLAPKPASRVAADTMFRLTDGRELANELAWVGEATWWRKQRLPEAVQLAGRYPLAWVPYSSVPGTGRGEFRWLMAAVG